MANIASNAAKEALREAGVAATGGGPIDKTKIKFEKTKGGSKGDGKKTGDRSRSSKIQLMAMKKKKCIKHNKEGCDTKGCKYPHECCVCGKKGCAAHKHADLGACSDASCQSQSGSAPLVTQPAWYSLRVIYLFTGHAWHADVGQCFSNLLFEFSDVQDLGFKATLVFREYDLLQNGAIIE